MLFRSPAVAKAMKDAAGDAELKEIELGDEDGTPAYEAVWTANGHKHEIAVAKDGTVLSIEEIISLKEAPEAVRAAIVKEAGDSEVIEVEKVIAKGKTTYEAVIKKGSGKVEVKFDEAGKVLERENPDAEKEEKSEKGETPIRTLYFWRICRDAASSISGTTPIRQTA